MPNSEEPFYYSIRSFARRSQSTDQPVPFFIGLSQRFISCPAHHGKVITSGMHTEIPSVPDDDFSFDRQINPAIMHLCCCGLNFANKAVIDVAFLMKLAAKIAFLSLFGPGSISAVASLSNPVRVFLRFSGIRLNECGICIVSSLSFKPIASSCFFKFPPDYLIFSSLCHAFSD